jgi:hypothetical protein
MASMKSTGGAAALAVIVLGSGCSWFHHSKPDAQAADASAASDAALAIGAPTAPDAVDMKATTTLVTDFYEMRARLGRTGLPNENDMNAYRAFVCPPLAAAMDAARVRQKLYIDEHPDDKPPLIQGDLFSSLLEGTDVVTPSGTEVNGDTATVTLSMRFGEGDQATRWKDKVLLARDQGSWCIADVEYTGDWPFANKGKLSTTLAEPF